MKILGQDIFLFIFCCCSKRFLFKLNLSLISDLYSRIYLPLRFFHDINEQPNI